MSNFAQEERSLAGTNIIWSLAVELSCGFGTNWKFVHWGACLPAVQAPIFFRGNNINARKMRT